MRKKSYLLFFLFILSLQTGCLYAVRYDGTYRGKVVDQHTNDPVEGVVVLGTWHTVELTVGGGVSYFYDARETVTDKNGEFSIPGQGLHIMSSLEPMSVLIFKVGYQYIGPLGWGSIKIAYSEEIKWEGDKPIFPLKKLTLEERKKLGGLHGPPSQASYENVNLMLKEINKDEIGRGIAVTNKIWRGHKIE